MNMDLNACLDTLIPGLSLVPNHNPTLMGAALVRASPCPVVSALMPNEYRERSRSCYFPKRRGKWKRDQDYIYLNETYVWNTDQGAIPTSFACFYVLAHELGHALDHHNLHPLQDWMGRNRASRYRSELAAASFAHGIMHHCNLLKRKTIVNHMRRDVEYVERYTRPESVPDIQKVIDWIQGES